MHGARAKGVAVMSHNGVQGDNRYIGYFPITGDPIHWGHIEGALRVRQAFGLEAVYIQVCGDVPDHKPDKTHKEHRHAMAQLAIAMYAPALRYTPLGYNNDLVGEDNFRLFVMDPAFAAVDRFYYIAGMDNRSVVMRRLGEGQSIASHHYEIVFLTRDESDSVVGAKTVVVNARYSSSRFRSGADSSAVPPVVLDYCRKYRLYGYGQ